MVQKITWKTRARISYNRIIDFLLLVWIEEVAANFIKLVDEKIELLYMHPELGAYSKDEGFRKTVIHEKCRFVLRLHA